VLRRAVLIAIGATLLYGGALAGAHEPPLLVFAAASLKNALDEIGAAWTKQSGTAVRVSYAASPALAKQIEQGAPADLFIAADLDWMDYVDQKGLLRPGTRQNLLGNALVLVASKEWSKGEVKIELNFPLGALLGDGRLAIASTAAVPAGKYGKAALEKLGAWTAVAGKLAEAENVRAALAFVARGEAPLGIVYRTDAAAEPNVIVVGTFPADSHPPIVYPAAVLAGAKHPQAEALRRYLAGPEARRIFGRHGFAVLAAPSSS
jgi:molybdate transport system substrate-binding protein